MKLFQENKPFFKGNLHCHTTQSDGARTPDEVIEIYRALGYDFLAITDHRRVTIAQNQLRDGMLLLAGIELDYTLAAEVVHIVGFGMTKDIEREIDYSAGPQGGIDTIRKCSGRAILAHPHWSLNTLPTLTGLRDATASEIYNSMSFLRPDSSDILDVASSHGKLYPLVAADDSHSYAGEQGMSYTMVQADSLTAQAIATSMDQGLFYASQGPQIEQITLEEGRIIVECSPADRIYFHSNLPWSPGRAVIAPNLTRAAYTLCMEHGERFVRCQVIDANGRSAWSSPIAL